MNNGFNLISILTLLGAAHGIFLALALINSQKGDVRSHQILALFTFLFSLDLGEEFLYQVGFFASVPDLLNVLAPIDLCYGPLIYLYVSRLTGPMNRQFNVRQLWHFLPALIGILLLMPFFVMGGAEKLALIEALRTGQSMAAVAEDAAIIEPGLTLFVLGTIVQLGCYLFLSIRLLIRHSRNIKNEFSDIDRISLAWLRNLLIGLSIIYLLYLGDQFFPDLMGINFLGDLITVLAVIMVYAMGYIGIRQPAIFSRELSVQAPDADKAGGPTSAKYVRSGLDSETSRIFLDEISSHMQTEKPYLQGDLTLPQLAQQLAISPNYLSQIINEQLDVNFYDFVNGYRINESRRLIREAGNGKINVLAIALDSGFNSKSAFYTAFKKVTSMTPTEFRNSL